VPLVGSRIFQLSLFDERDLANITADDYPRERLIVCRNPELAARRRKREDLLATERDLAEIQNRVRRTERPLRGTAKIARKAGAIIGKYKMAKHFTLTITDADFSFARKQDAIDIEARLDGIYVVRTNLAGPSLDDSATVRAYKSLAQAERAIRSLKTVDLHIRPIFHWTPSRVTSSGICANASPRCSTTMPTRQPPKPREPASVANAQRSRSAIAKQTHGTTPDGLPVHSLRTLLADLATLARNRGHHRTRPTHAFVVHTRPTKLQQKALDLLTMNAATCTQ